MKTITWHNKARKQMKRISAHYRESIFEHVDQLTAFPNCKELDIKPLKNHECDYRMRVGRYRVLFNEELEIIEVMEVKKRDERTY